MAEFTLVVGNKNYSSWSLRAWLMLKQAEVDFDEELIPLYTPGSRNELMRLSPSGRVPVLRHGDLTIWETIAIGEYLAELSPLAGLWPKAKEARAVARAVSAEMHAGFAALRGHFPMNMRSAFPNRPPTPEAQTDINRIEAIWRDCRKRFGGEGDFLLGSLSIADAMYAPVVSRFRTYKIDLDAEAQRYADAIWALPAFQEWLTAAGNEPMIIEEAEF